MDCTLTKHAIQEAKLVIPFARLENQVAKNAMMQIDRNGIWGKYYTKSIKISDGQSAEIHFYMESKTGNVY